MEQRKLTCIICPMGCQLTVNLIKGDIVSVVGNTCARGEKYAMDECVNPMRTITTTMRCDNGEVISVKTDKPIPKDKLFLCMKIINNNIAGLPISVGDVIIEDIFGSNVVATKNMI